MTGNQAHHAHAIALSIAHSQALADLLRAHGKIASAAAMENAIRDLAEITATQVGERPLKKALEEVHVHPFH